MTQSLPSVSIVVPTFREAKNLPILLPQVAQALRQRGWTWEIIVVDDNSDDGTPEVLEGLERTFPQLRHRIRKDERGLSSAVIAGLQMARHNYLVVMDADLSHPPQSVPALVDKLIKDEADFVIGSRYVEGGRTEDWGYFRWLNSAVATSLSKPFVGAVRDPMAGFFALRRDTLALAGPLNPIGYKIGLELIVKCGIKRVAEVPIIFRNRVHGESKLTMREQFRYLEHLSRLYDFQYPKGSPRVKFLIAVGCSFVGSIATLYACRRGLEWGFAASMAMALLCMIGVSFAFFVRYVRTQKDFLVMQRPYSEFFYISTAEYISGWLIAFNTDSRYSIVRATVGLTVLVLIRYTLRKVFLHDIRGIRGTPKAETLRLTFTPAPLVLGKPAATA